MGAADVSAIDIDHDEVAEIIFTIDQFSGKHHDSSRDSDSIGHDPAEVGYFTRAIGSRRARASITINAHGQTRQVEEV